MESGYEKLDIYKLALDLTIQVHRLSLELPKFEMYEEGSQIRRSSKSVGANIVEGYCLRRHRNEFLQYLHRAMGSAQETIYHLRVLHQTQSCGNANQVNELIRQYIQLSKMIFRLIKTVITKHTIPDYASNPTVNFQE